jgi:hypothetical protein
MEPINQTQQQVQMQGVEMKDPPRPDIFLSYASDAGEWAGRVRDLLFRSGSQVDSTQVDDFNGRLGDRSGYTSGVVLLTPGYVSSEYARMELSALSRNGAPVVPVFGIHLQRTPIRDAPWLQAVEILPPTGAALLDLEAPDAELERIVASIRRIADRLFALNRPRETAPEGGRNMESAAPEPSSTAGSSDTPDSPDTPDPLQALLAQYRVFGSVRNVLLHAAEYAAAASPPARLSTSLVLLTFAEHGAVTQAPAWAGDWVRMHLGEAFHGLRSGYFEEKRIPGESRPGGRAAGLNPGIPLALERAREFARRTTGVDEIRARHLLAALLTDGRRDAGALQQLRRAGLDPAAMVVELYDFVRGYGDDDEAWGRILLGRVERDARLSGFHADDSRSDDYLDVRPDVQSFAKLIAARTVNPLFGEWGSGKTFFMRMLQDEVRRLAARANESRQMQRELPYWKRIVQIEFNAWHYVEENLWASLANRIFETLHNTDRRSASWRVREHLELQCDQEKSLVQSAEHDKEAAEKELRSAEEALHRAQREFAELSTSVSGESLLAAVDVARVRDAVSGPLQDLGIVRLGGSAADVVKEVERAHAELTGLGRILVPLFRGPQPGRRNRQLLLAAAVLGAPLFGLLVAVAMDLLGPEGAAQISGWTTGGVAMLGTAAEWLRRQIPLVRRWRTNVETAKRRMDDRLVREYDRLRQARAQHGDRQLQAESAEAKLEAARARVAQAEARLRSASLAEELTRFVTERFGSGEYRKQLSTLARVREDFERVSELIEEENWRLVPPLPGEDISRRGLKKFETPEEEAGDRGTRVNRIVLYIDDLDRCPPAKVVEVLQAVHLLLAFPLFVVVVGVDARWVVRSVETRYRELLRGGDEGRNGDSDSREFLALFGTATAHDYLEKIFQVPFWLRPMTDRACQAMVRGLLAAGVQHDTAVATIPPASAAGASMEDATRAAAAGPHPAEAEAEAVAEGVASGEAGAARDADTAPASAPSPLPAAAADSEASGQAKPAADAEVPGVEDEPGMEEDDLSPEALQIHPDEVAAIEEFAPLLGRSPRALKRFVNVYRLIKTSLTPYERKGWVTRPAFLSANAVPDYYAVLFLLAVDTGAPAAAPAVFRAIQELSAPLFFKLPEEMRLSQRKVLSNQRSGTLPTLDDVVNRLDRDPALRGEPDWARVRQWLVRDDGTYRLPNDLGRLGRWVPRVSRYSFHTGRMARREKEPAPRPARPIRWIGTRKG